MAVFFTSDTHFGDHRVLSLYPRPFASAAEMDAAMISNWNAVVGEDDGVWHLGDFARTAKEAGDLLERLNGRKHLLLGNNDPPGAPSEVATELAAELRLTAAWLGLEIVAIARRGDLAGALQRR